MSRKAGTIEDRIEWQDIEVAIKWFIIHRLRDAFFHIVFVEDYFINPVFGFKSLLGIIMPGLYCRMYREGKDGIGYIRVQMQKMKKETSLVEINS